MNAGLERGASVPPEDAPTAPSSGEPPLDYPTAMAGLLKVSPGILPPWPTRGAPRA